MKNWYHCILGQVKGPFSLLEMEKMIEQKEIDTDDLIYCSGEKRWTCVIDRWQFQKAISKSNKVQNMPKKDWVVLKQENIEDNSKNKSLSNYQYLCYSTKEVLQALHKGEIFYSHWIWTHGMKDWKCIRNLPIFNKQIATENAEKASNTKSFNLGEVSDVELYQSVMRAKPSSSLISSLIETGKKVDEAQGPSLTKQFGNLKFGQNKDSDVIRSKSLSHQSIQEEKFSSHLLSSLTGSKNQNRSYLSKGLYIIGIFFVSLCVIGYLLLPSYMNEKLHKKNIPLQYKVLHNGLELHFWIEQYAKSKVLLKIKNDRQQTLTANKFEHHIKLVLDKDGRAILRLDHLELVEGYYTFLGQIDEDKFFSRKFFVGKDKETFTYKLSEFHQIRQQEKQKLETIKRRKIVNVIAKQKQPVPKSVETLYGQVRQLEKGYDRYNKDVTEWRSFYSSWETSFNQLQSSALGYVKEELDLELTRELQIIEQELKVMGEQMDKSIKESHIEGFDLLSPQVAVFLEKMKSNNRF